MILIGVIFGFIVGLTSIGSGSLFAIAMLYLFRMKTAEVVGTDIAHAFLLVTAAGLLNASFGSVDYLLVLNLLIGSVRVCFSAASFRRNSHRARCNL